MTTKRALSILLILVAAPAFADGRTQLERSAGVAAGSYTLSELAQIVAAEDDNDAARLKRYLAGSEVAVTRSSGYATSGSLPYEGGSKGSDH